jgi:hypothetical protein
VFALNGVPQKPTAPLATQIPEPECGFAVIRITDPVDGITYSIDGVTYYDNGGLFVLRNVPSGRYYVSAKNAAGCISDATPVDIIVYFNTPPVASVTQQPTCDVPTGTITITYPVPAPGQTYTVSGSTSTGYPGPSYTNTSGIFTGLAPNTYSVSASGGCFSDNISLTVNPAPGAPAAPVASITQQPSCTVATGTITVTSPAPAAGITFSIDGVDYTNTNGIFTGLSAGLYSVTVRNAEGCVSSATQLTINQAEGTPDQPADFNVYIETICRGSSAKYGVPNDPSVTYRWSYTGTGVEMIQNTNSVMMTFSETATTGVLSVVAINGCGLSQAREMTITVRPLPSPAGIISGPSIACPGMKGVVYSVAEILNASSYIWTVPVGATIVGGAGTNEITVDFSETFVSGVFTVKGRKSCGTGLVSPELYVTSGVKPAQPGSFTEFETTVCRGGTATYTVPDDQTATYSWTYSGVGATIAANNEAKGNVPLSGAKCNTHSVIVSFSDVATSGTLSVVAVNGCGTSVPRQISITVRELPGDAGLISGLTAVCQGTTGVVYTVPEIPNATGYIWKVPGGASIVGGLNTRSITVDYSSSSVSGIITVQGIKSCGVGKVSPELKVRVNAIPAPPMINITENTLNSSVNTGNQWYFNGEPLKEATNGSLTVKLNGEYYSIVTQEGCASEKSNIIDVKLSETKVMLREDDIEMYPVPNKGQFTVIIDSKANADELVDILVFNSIGNKVYEKQNVVMNGRTQILFDLGTLPAGIYHLRFISRNGQVIKTMIMNK